MAKNPQFHGRAKHIDIRYHFVVNKLVQEQLSWNIVEDGGGYNDERTL